VALVVIDAVRKCTLPVLAATLVLRLKHLLKLGTFANIHLY
jgi:hypothetical protein